MAGQAFAARAYDGGGALKCRTVCLGGQDWDHASNAYVETDGAVPAVLTASARQAHAAAAAVDGALPAFDAPDVVVCNFYEEAGRMGLHRERRLRLRVVAMQAHAARFFIEIAHNSIRYIKTR